MAMPHIVVSNTKQQTDLLKILIDHFSSDLSFQCSGCVNDKKKPTRPAHSGV